MCNGDYSHITLFRLIWNNIPYLGLCDGIKHSDKMLISALRTQKRCISPPESSRGKRYLKGCFVDCTSTLHICQINRALCFFRCLEGECNISSRHLHVVCEVGVVPDSEASYKAVWRQLILYSKVVFKTEVGIIFYECTLDNREKAVSPALSRGRCLRPGGDCNYYALLIPLHICCLPA